MGTPCRASWFLTAEAGVGPIVPAIPAVAMVQEMIAGRLMPGACAAAGLLSLGTFERLIEDLPISTGRSAERLRPLAPFPAALGAAFGRLPRATRIIHTPGQAMVLEGAVDVDGAETLVGRILARLIGFPTYARGAPLCVIIEPNGAEETWTRLFPGRRLFSVLSRPDAVTSTIEERFGPLRFRTRLEASAEGLRFVPIGGRLGWLAIPSRLLSRVTAFESEDQAGRHRFDVAIAVPMVGRIVRYRGWLDLAAPNHGPVRQLSDLDRFGAKATSLPV
jgi:hypothetical protein